MGFEADISVAVISGKTIASHTFFDHLALVFDGEKKVSDMISLNFRPNESKMDFTTELNEA